MPETKDERNSDHIYEGALAFLNAEYRLLSVFVLIVSAVLAGISFIVPTTHILIVVSFIFGAFFCLCRKHRDEDSNQNQCKNNSSC